MLSLNCLVLGQQASGSFNDMGVSFIESDQRWEAIQSLERAVRSGGSQARAARQNLQNYRSEIDLPAHTILHFGWIQGIGRMANVLVNNFWWVLAVLLLLTSPFLYFLKNDWNWRRAILCTSFSVVCFFLAFCRAEYRSADGIVIISSDSELKEKPYAESPNKQILFEGQMASVLSTYEGFTELQTDTYETGWVSTEYVKTIWSENSKMSN